MKFRELLTTPDEPTPASETAYYECPPCGYRSPVEVSTPLCPHCGDTISETTRY